MTRVVLSIVLVSLLALPVASQALSSQQWIDVEGPQGAKLRAVVFRPSGDGPFAVVVVLHGAPRGLRDEVLDWGPDLAHAGFVTVVGCYFKGSNTVRVDANGTWMARRASGVGKNVNPCPVAPGLRDAHPVENVIALIDAGRRLPGARRDRVGLLGWSTGGGMAALVASAGANVQAVVSFAGSFRETLFKNEPRSAMSVVQDLRAPILILHGTKDTIEPTQTSRDYEARARELGKTVEAYYLEGASHWIFGIPQSRTEDLLPRSVEFLNKYLRP